MDEWNGLRKESSLLLLALNAEGALSDAVSETQLLTIAEESSSRRSPMGR
jgi:hypothetical protein